MYGEGEHIYEEIIYSKSTPPPSVITVTTTTVPSSSHAVLINSTPSTNRRLAQSKSMINLNGESKKSSSKRKSSFWFTKPNPVANCNCCLKLMSSRDMANSILPKYRKCNHCNEFTCKKCLDDYSRCHECFVRLTTILEPKDMMRMRTKTLLNLILLLHYPEESFLTAHKAYLVKQLLTRFHKYPDFDPKRYIEKHLMKSTENLIDAGSSVSKSSLHSSNQKMSSKHHSTRHHCHQELRESNPANQRNFGYDGHAIANNPNELQRSRSKPNLIADLPESQRNSPMLSVSRRQTQSYRQASVESNLQRCRSIDSSINDKPNDKIKLASAFKKPELKSLDEKIAIFETKYNKVDEHNPSLSFSRVSRQGSVEPRSQNGINGILV